MVTIFIPLQSSYSLSGWKLLYPYVWELISFHFWFVQHEYVVQDQIIRKRLTWRAASTIDSISSSFGGLTMVLRALSKTSLWEEMWWLKSTVTPFADSSNHSLSCHPPCGNTCARVSQLVYAGFPFRLSPICANQRKLKESLNLCTEIPPKKYKKQYKKLYCCTYEPAGEVHWCLRSLLSRVFTIIDLDSWGKNARCQQWQRIPRAAHVRHRLHLNSCGGVCVTRWKSYLKLEKCFKIQNLSQTINHNGKKIALLLSDGW